MSDNGSATLIPDKGKAGEIADQVERLKAELLGELEKDINKNGEKCATLEKRINDGLTELRDEIKKHSKAISVPGTGEKDSGRKFNLGLALHAQYTRNWRYAGYEKDVIDAAWDEWNKRNVELPGIAKAMGTSPDSAGGLLVPMEVMEDQFIDVLRADSVAIALGATRLTGLAAIPVRIQKKTASITAEWVGENPAASVTATDMTLAPVDLIPKRTAGNTLHSDQVAQWSSPSLASLLQRDHAEQHALAVDLAAMKGSGSSNQPKGIIGATGVTDFDFTGTNAAEYKNYEDLVAMEHKVMQNNAFRGRLGWALHPNFFHVLRKIKSEATTGAHGEVARTVVGAPAPTTILGHPYGLTTQLNGTDGTAEMIFGNWAELLIGEWNSLLFKTTDAVGEAAARFQMNVISWMDVDMALRHGQSFCVTDDGPAIA